MACLKPVFIVLAMVCSVQALADSSSNRHFLTLGEGQKRWYYNGVFSSLAHVASTQYNKEKSNCVWEWYFKYPERRRKQLKKSFEMYPEGIPSSVILALLKRDCGVFGE
ncbi:MAG: hypothetical protein AAF988_04750 [Pseudomonadota bacterium]